MKKSLLQLSVCILMGVALLLAGSATAEKAADVEADVGDQGDLEELQGRR